MMTIEERIATIEARIASNNNMKKSHIRSVPIEESDTESETTCCSSSGSERSLSSASSSSDQSTHPPPNVVSIAKRSRKDKKKVCFADDLLGRNTYMESKLILSDDDIEALWWKRKDYKIFKKNCKQVANIHSEELINDFDLMYVACSNGHLCNCLKVWLDLYNTAEDEKNEELRGLEGLLYPIFVRDRKSVQQIFLRTQRKLPSAMDLNARQQYLAVASRHLSRQSRHLSTVIGSGDAVIVLAGEMMMVVQ